MSTKGQVNYNDLKMLWFCVKCRHFTKAAQELNRTQSTVSCAMKRLALQTKQRLFVAGKSKEMIPTAYAVKLARMIEPVIRELEIK